MKKLSSTFHSSLLILPFSCYTLLMSVTHREPVSADSVAEASPPYADEGLNEDGLYPDGVCPICAAHDYMPNAETIAAIEEGRAMLRGEIPAKWFDSFEEMWEDLNRDEPDDMDD